jgi:hypothetical protein
MLFSYRMKNSILLFTCLMLVACERNIPATGDFSVVRDSVRTTLHRYYEDIGRRGLTAEFNYLDSSAGFFWVPPGYSSALSYDSVRSILQKSAPMFTSVYNTFDTLCIFPLSLDLASYTCRIRSVMTDTSGKTNSCTLMETGILIRRKTGWKLLNGQTSVINQ